MSILQLNGKRESYLFDPENESTVLKRNGKFGRVYAGSRISDKKPVVVKFLNPLLKLYPDAVQQFRFEDTLELAHPQLRTTYEFIKAEGEFFLVQEYINGIDMKTFLHRHSKLQKDVGFIIRCVIKILDALEYLHSRNIIHCDIKPSNILIEYDRSKKKDFENPGVRLIDLGLAKLQFANFFSATNPFSLIYSPPEQVLHFTDLINPSSDLHALGMTLYELISGDSPFRSNHPEMIMHRQVSGGLDENRKIPEALFKILQKATSKNTFPLPPNQMSNDEQKIIIEEGMKKRYQTVAEMRVDLLSFLSNVPVKKSFFSKLFG